MGILGYHWGTPCDPDYVGYSGRELSPEEQARNDRIKDVLFKTLVNRRLIQ